MTEEDKNPEKIQVGEGKGTFVVLTLGIIYDPKERKILIGKRKEDPNIPKLTWAFPGGRPEDKNEELDEAVKKELKKETGLNVENLGPVYAKTYPEKRDFLAIYYLCENNSLNNASEEKLQPGDNFEELKWVEPEELENYFTTSFHPHLKEYVLNLEKNNNSENSNK